MKTDPNKPTYPIVHPDEDVIIGLTIREHFAAMAMQGLASNSGLDIMTARQYANDGVMFADALIEALNKQQ